MERFSKKGQMRIAIIGAGKVGVAVGCMLQKKGFNIVAIAGRSKDSLCQAQNYISGHTTQDIVEASRLANVIFITTNDDQIERVCKNIAHAGGIDPGDMVFHFSGALSTNILEAAKNQGAMVGAIHPLQSFASIEGAITQLPGSFFGITASGDTFALASEVAEELGGRVISIKDEDKALYHTAACVASNYFVGLVHFAQGIYQDLGISREQALEALLPLIKGTLSNIGATGAAPALTGPIDRGDISTIKKHLAAFKDKAPDKERLYCEMGKYTALVALDKGSINDDKQKELHQILQGGKGE